MIQLARLAHTLAAALATVAALSSCNNDTNTDIDTAPRAADGRDIAQESGCSACHGPNGEGGTGPAWQRLWGTTVHLDDGTTQIADEDYIRRSIEQPSADVVDGYSNIMPTIELTSDEIDALIAYIRSLEGP